MTAEPDYLLDIPFVVDDGQLQGIPPEKVFVLGFEFAQVCRLVREQRSFEITVHAENIDRIQQLVSKYELSMHIEPLDEYWSVLFVEAEGNGPQQPPRLRLIRGDK